MTIRCSIAIRGAVQGVGFRPFIYRLATGMGLTGWVINSTQGVFIEVEGEKEQIDLFLLRIEQDKPAVSYIQSFEFSFLDPVGFDRFEIKQSTNEGTINALILPDIATCPECVQEIFDPANRRYLYPFTNCTNCGPRFSIIEALPYDRHNTTMKAFTMCDACRSEYENPYDRRFHAQPNACPVCGPQLELWDTNGIRMSSKHDALLEAVSLIRGGKIVALKGMGGFQLLVDARNPDAVASLRLRKHREEKPFAVMMPTLEQVKRHCCVSSFEERLLSSSESPIVLLQRNSLLNAGTEMLDESVAPGNPYLGSMLPYTPLHHILMRELGFPVVATSGNLSDEPICIDEQEAVRKLRDIAGALLVHNRPIRRHVDDSIVRMMMGREMVLRRARGYAPLPIRVTPSKADVSYQAVGAQLKNTTAGAIGDDIFLSQHIGDLDTQESFTAFQQVITDFRTLYNVQPDRIICDMHPLYRSTQYAQTMAQEVSMIQHHYAHVASCMAENQLDGRVLGIAWDGTGYGLDGTIWGGEFLLTDKESFQRVGTFRSFRLPGGERAIKEPRRSALGVLFELHGDAFFESRSALLEAFTPQELELLREMLRKDINSPVTTSAGRLFDAVSCLIGLRTVTRFEGQSAMEVEFLAHKTHTEETYPYLLIDENQKSQHPMSSFFTINWGPMIHSLEHDRNKGVSQSVIAAKFHNTLVETVVAISRKVGEKRVVLSGGCFQNVYLTERTIRRLRDEGFQPYWHQRVPPNDGGIALGQIYAAKRLTNTRRFQSQLHQEELHA